jgi:hypothetical protein
VWILDRTSNQTSHGKNQFHQEVTIMKRFGILFIIAMFSLALVCGCGEEKKPPAKPAAPVPQAEKAAPPNPQAAPATPAPEQPKAEQPKAEEKKPEGMGPGAGYGRMYNPQTVETVSGQLLSVDTMSWGRYQGVHLTVKTDKETIAVHLGPGWYLDQQKMTFTPKDTLEITGSRVTFDGKPAIIAAEVKKGGQSLKLRDANGIPMWAGQGRRQ